MTFCSYCGKEVKGQICSCPQAQDYMQRHSIHNTKPRESILQDNIEFIIDENIRDLFHANADREITKKVARMILNNIEIMLFGEKPTREDL